MPKDVGKKETGKPYTEEIPFVRFSACLLSQKRSSLNRGRGSDVETEQLQTIMSLFIVAEFILYMPGSVTQLPHAGEYILPLAI